MQRSRVDWRKLIQSSLAGMLVMAVARLLVVAGLYLVYGTVPRWVFPSELSGSGWLTLRDIYYLLSQWWIWTAYLLCGGVAGAAVWVYQDSGRPHLLDRALRVCFVAVLLTGGWAVWLGGVVVGMIFYPPPEGVIRPLVVALAGLSVEPPITAFAILRMPQWLNYLLEEWW